MTTPVPQVKQEPEMVTLPTALFRDGLIAGFGERLTALMESARPLPPETIVMSADEFLKWLAYIPDNDQYSILRSLWYQAAFPDVAEGE